MQRKLPGIDIPAATEAKILHAAAFLEFKNHVERLAREGLGPAAYTCWMHGIEVLHSPYVHHYWDRFRVVSPLAENALLP